MKFALFAFVVALLAGLSTALLIPAKSLNPGRLTSAHVVFGNDCLSCHILGSGTPATKCTSCHKQNEIGQKLTTGATRDTLRPAIAGLHKGLNGRECLDCHTDHRGAAADSATARFAHDLLPRDIANRCADCHGQQKPEDQVHRIVPPNCGLCHDSQSWRGAQFRHDLLGSDVAQQCATCHLSRTPTDDLHQRVGGQTCVSCHSTTAWKPSTFEHSRYFEFDGNHPSRCADCHAVSVSLKTYSCYNCHEHTPQKIAREHVEEGIRDFANCVACHKSGNRRDEERQGRDRGERNGRESSEEHDDD